jgi:hypothetical protein
MTSMPLQRPGQSKQDYGTPWKLIRAIEKRWGKLELDLAAHDDGSNAKAPNWIGPSVDYLLGPLSLFDAPYIPSLAFCNPPFENIDPWTRRWRQDMLAGFKIISLVPASIGSDWFRFNCHGVAQVIALSPRIAFEGCHQLFPKTSPRAGERKCGPECLGCANYPKDCMLLLWGEELHVSPEGYELNAELRNSFSLITWRWDQ